MFRSDENKNPSAWSPDGRHVLFDSQSSSTNMDVWALPLDGDRQPFVVAGTPFIEAGGQVSPDGRWVAYQSNETGRAEIHVQPFPGPGVKTQVSVGGGSAARWRGDGRELFYVAPDNRLMSVSVTLSPTRITASLPRALLALPANMGYVASEDGQRFLVAASTSEASPITVILNWKPPQN